ncbi:serine/threonine protein kinase [Streptomyces sp. NBC_01142]|uniref:serine/threonine-protein kinase n=1 Tax=Streptomyces sp. NBC_01142 TaxID=2975865 RepID=UPI002253ABB0|nr:serine/threonine-protein kinase [Streptomyces sp. NBC_01142]MCX4824680.1 serine/threonine protein kinase [Streptomyces sp. NBC_01142]
MEQLAPGDPQHIGAYRLLARLGAGGMGQVYLARSDRGRTVAVKLVRGELAEQEEFRSRFRQEVRAALRVGGEWTAPVLDADTEAPVPWVATGYVAGPSLHSVVSGDHGPLPERSVRILASGLAHALENIHGADLIHRDLKPSNILVTIDGPRVIDFGIARALETVTDGGLTRTGALIGSPGFMAPEQVRGDRVTAACDVFCLGAVLAYAATGRFPFGSADSGVHALMFRIAQEEPDLAGLPEGLLGLVRDCLNKDPEARPSLAQILERTTSDADGEPWLPGALIAQLGRHAVQLLEVEQPADTPPAPPAHPAPPAPPAPVAPQGEHALPTMISAPSPPPPMPAPPAPAPAPAPPPPPPPAYGYPQQQPPPYGYPQQQPYPHQPHQPHQAFPTYAPEPPRRGNRGATAALIAVALVVAVVAGGSVYAFMGKDGKKTAQPEDPKPQSTNSAPTTPGTKTPSATPGATPATTPAAGGVPAEYVGTWQGSFETADGTNTRVMTITQGGTGETVMTLTGTGSNYDCRWSATLRASGPPLELGPTQVTFGDPKTCSPGQWSRLNMPNDTTIVRELVGSSGEPITYTKTS